MFFYPTIKFQDLLVSTKKLGEIQNKDMKGKFKMREAFSFYEKCQKKLYMLNANLCPLIFSRVGIPTILCGNPSRWDAQNGR
jgi:hypothetical protein